MSKNGSHDCQCRYRHTKTKQGCEGIQPPSPHPSLPTPPCIVTGQQKSAGTSHTGDERPRYHINAAASRREGQRPRLAPRVLHNGFLKVLPRSLQPFSLPFHYFTQHLTPSISRSNNQRSRDNCGPIKSCSSDISSTDTRVLYHRTKYGTWCP